MRNIEIEAIQNLANIPAQDGQYEFQPYKSIVFMHKYKSANYQKRPQTVSSHQKRQISMEKNVESNKREQLKKELQILEAWNQQEIPKAFKQRKKMVTTQSVFCMTPSAFATSYNGFPSQPIKKSNPQSKPPKYTKSKQNQIPYSFLKTQDLIRMDIKKKFQIRQSNRQCDKLTKINNFLKMATCNRRMGNCSNLLQKLQQKKLRQTLTNILS